MSKQTAVEWLENQIKTSKYFYKLMEDINSRSTVAQSNIFEQAKAMEKEQIINTFKDAQVFKVMNDETRAEQYYNEQYVSKESDDHIGDANEMIEISDESWEGCDGCTEQDEIMYKNGYVKGYNAAVSELPKEISDEEIEEQSWGYREVTKDMEIPPNEDWSNGAKWYREQLKNK
jgi:hypothetical protein